MLTHRFASCLLINSSSSQDSILRVLSGLKSQVKRVEDALQANPQSSTSPGETTEEDNRVSRNLRTIAEVGEKFHSSASTVVRDARSTVWGGSMLGDSLTEEQASTIEKWIPPPADEEQTPVSTFTYDIFSRSEESSSTVVGNEYISESDDEIDQDLTKRLEELAIESRLNGNNPRAESFYRRAIERGEAGKKPKEEIRAMRVHLANVCMLQEKWAEAEAIISPMAFERQVHSIEVYHAMHALALVHLHDFELLIAHRCCKRALWGKRKVVGKTDPSYFDTLGLLASICDKKDDVAEAEAHRSFIPTSVCVVDDADALGYLRRHSTPVTQAQDTLQSQPAAITEEPSASDHHPATVEETPESTPRQPSAPEFAETFQLSPKTSFSVLEAQEPNSQRSSSAPMLDQPHAYKASPKPVTRSSTAIHDRVAERPPHRRSILKSPLEHLVEAPSRARLIVGVHFGVVRSCVAFVYTQKDDMREGVITEWPGADRNTNVAVMIEFLFGLVQC